MRVPISPQALLERLAAVAHLTQGIEALGIMAFITDPDGHILFANEATERITGFTRKEMIGRNPGDLWGGQMPEAFYVDFWKTIKTDKKPFVAEMHNRRKDGVMHWQEMFVTPIMAENGDVEFFIAVEPDITERKEREKFREEFTSILSHQLKNPLTAVNWTIELLLERNGLRPDQKAALHDAYEGSKSMVGLIEDLVTISRLGQTPAHNDSVNIVQELDEVVALAKRHHPKVVVDYQPPAATNFVTSRVLMLQVLSNIVSNAFEYADAEAPKVRIAMHISDRMIRLEVENNGLTIPADAKEKIFDKFYRTEAAAAYKASGTGLGLFIVKMICDTFGWKIGFESPRSEKGGTMFYVEMPRT
ncbi:MAG: PAS domain-containing sensor histidine kinase [Patescibacteria group bacterium]|nr:MAG: PAS domain-containing sensor histidine kinase [Patescibacteria group bacterium]